MFPELLFPLRIADLRHALTNAFVLQLLLLLALQLLSMLPRELLPVQLVCLNGCISHSLLVFEVRCVHLVGQRVFGRLAAEHVFRLLG